MKIDIKSLNDSNADFVIHYCLSFENTDPTEQAVKTFKNKLYKKIERGKYWCFVAILNNKPVGYIDVEIRNNFGIEDFWINEIYISEEFQRQKIGTALLKHVTNLSEKLGFSDLHVFTEIENHPSIQLLEKHSFSHVYSIYRKKTESNKANSADAKKPRG